MIMRINLKYRYSIAALIAFALTACAQQAPRSDVPLPAPDPVQTAPVTQDSRKDTPPPARSRTRPTPAPRPAPGAEVLPVTPSEPAREITGAGSGSRTGVPICDRYLASFRQCQSTIGQNTPQQIDQRYERIRSALMRKSGTPEGRAEISKSCKVLERAMQAGLGERKCGDPPR